MMRTMAAGKFKATCLAVMDEVEARREPVLVTKNGRPTVMMVPLESKNDPLEVFRFPGKIEIHGDIMAPMYSDEEYEEFFQESMEQLK
jgi:prevent-host-death family protein